MMLLKMNSYVEKMNIYSPLKSLSILLIAIPLLSACSIGGGMFDKKSDINNTTKFSSSEYGVVASKRVTTSSRVKKGGGRSQIGKPYKIRGKWYTPAHDPDYDATGVASWYGPNFHGRETANGEIFDQYAISAAHPTLPLPSYVRVTNLENNKSIMVRVNDRGPFSSSRIIDLSKRTADLLGVIKKGTARVRVRYVGKAPLEGDDTRMLLASMNKSSSIERMEQFDRPAIKVANIFTRTNAPIPSIRQSSGVNTGYSQTSQGFFIANSFSSNLNNQQTTLSEPLSPIFYAPNISNKNSDIIINQAFLAVDAMASKSNNLEQWRNANDENARKINLELGVFANLDHANKVIRAFSLIAAVEQTPVQLYNKPALKLTLSYLKSGVTRKDAILIARELGLKDIILYN